MRLIAQFMIVLFAVVTISGYGAARPLVYHAQAHHHSDVDVSAVSHSHDHEAGATVPIAMQSGSSVDFCAQASCEAPESDQSGAHFHIPCCGAFTAVPPVEFGFKVLAISVVDQPIGRSSLALGELRYPLLRPPCQVV